MKYVLVKSRHKHNVINNLPAIFNKIENDKMFNYIYHKKLIHEVLKDKSNTRIFVYVTGITPLLISVINYCKENNIMLILFHYDITEDDYIPQIVL